MVEVKKREISTIEARAATRRHDLVIVELETKVLDADRQRAEAHRRLADREVNLARRRTDLHKAQAAAGR